MLLRSKAYRSRLSALQMGIVEVSGSFFTSASLLFSSIHNIHLGPLPKRQWFKWSAQRPSVECHFDCKMTALFLAASLHTELHELTAWHAVHLSLASKVPDNEWNGHGNGECWWKRMTKQNNATSFCLLLRYSQLRAECWRLDETTFKPDSGKYPSSGKDAPWCVKIL